MQPTARRPQTSHATGRASLEASVDQTGSPLSPETESPPQTESIPAARSARCDSAAHSALHEVSAAVLRLCSSWNCLSEGWSAKGYHDSFRLSARVDFREDFTYVATEFI